LKKSIIIICSAFVYIDMVEMILGFLRMLFNED